MSGFQERGDKYFMFHGRLPKCISKAISTPVFSQGGETLGKLWQGGGHPGYTFVPFLGCWQVVSLTALPVFCEMEKVIKIRFPPVFNVF